MLKIAITNLGKYNEGYLIYEWLKLPFYDEEDFDEVLEKIGINEEYEEFFISDYESDFEGLKVEEYEDIKELNYKMQDIARLNNYDLEKFKAMIEWIGFEEAFEELNNIDDFNFYEGIHSDYDIGYAYFDILGYDTQENQMLVRYFDYEAFGRDIRLESNGDFVSNGWIERF